MAPHGRTRTCSARASTAGACPLSLDCAARVGAPPLCFALHLFGFSWQQWQGAALPLDLGIVGAGPGCVLSSSGEVVNAVVTGFTGGASFDVLVPNSGSLVDVTVFGAWVVLDDAAPANPGGFVSSDSLAVTIGA